MEQELDNLTARLSSEQPLVDLYDQESVGKYNSLVDRQRNMIADYESRIALSDTQFEITNAAVDRFNAKCADMNYYEHDMAAVLLQERP